MQANPEDPSIIELIQHIASEFQEKYGVPPAESKAMLHLIIVVGCGEMAENIRIKLQEANLRLSASQAEQFESLLQERFILMLFEELGHRIPPVNGIPAQFRDDVALVQGGCWEMQKPKDKCESAIAILKKTLGKSN